MSHAPHLIHGLSVCLSVTRPTRINTTNGISRFAGLTVVIDRQRYMRIFGNGTHLAHCLQCRRCGQKT